MEILKVSRKVVNKVARLATINTVQVEKITKELQVYGLLYEYALPTYRTVPYAFKFAYWPHEDTLFLDILNA